MAENSGRESNERLEFLGDAVLGVAIAERIFHDYGTLPEGELAKIRSEVVCASALVEVATANELGSGLHLGKGERATGGADKPSILADAMEAVIGAVFLDGGWEPARALINDHFDALIVRAANAPGLEDHKTTLQELAARQLSAAPVYEISEDGPDHAKAFAATVLIDGKALGHGSGSTKKEAEQQAAAVALDQLASPDTAGDR